MGILMSTSTRVIRSVLNRASTVIWCILVVHLLAGLLFSLVEHRTVMDGLWWSNITGFTVGYGDLYPQTVLMRVITMWVYNPLAGVLWLVLGAHIVAAIIEDKNLFSNDEQERHEAALLEISKKLGVVPEEFAQLPSVEWWQKNRGFQPDPE